MMRALTAEAHTLVKATFRGKDPWSPATADTEPMSAPQRVATADLKVPISGRYIGYHIGNTDGGKPVHIKRYKHMGHFMNEHKEWAYTDHLDAGSFHSRRGIGGDKSASSFDERRYHSQMATVHAHMAMGKKKGATYGEIAAKIYGQFRRASWSVPGITDDHYNFGLFRSRS